MKNANLSRLGGFTLIELLVVVLIIGILAGVALPQYQKAVTKTRFMRLLPLTKAISDAENVYYMANGAYTLNFDDLDIALPSGATYATSSRLDYDNYYCYLRWDGAAMESSSVYCNDKSPNAPTLEKYFVDTNYICWGISDFAQGVCKSVSGGATPEEHATGGFGYRF